jgi:hypothetical protein
VVRADGAEPGDAFEEAADDLYGRPAEDFVAARTERARTARDAGDRDTAARIARLAKPTAAAWLANQLVRQHHEDVQRLVDLGAAMRAATASLDRDELRRLTGEQRTLTAALNRQAQDDAATAGVRTNETTVRALDDILHAALAEPSAADQLLSGRLTGTLRSSGFPAGSDDEMVWSAGPAAPKSDGGATTVARTGPERPTARATRADRDAERERTRAALQAAAADADATRESARAGLDRADDELRRARRRADELRERLDRAIDDIGTAERARRAAREQADQADRAARAARRRLDEANAGR